MLTIDITPLVDGFKAPNDTMKIVEKVIKYCTHKEKKAQGLGVETAFKLLGWSGIEMHKIYAVVTGITPKYKLTHTAEETDKPKSYGILGMHGVILRKGFATKEGAEKALEDDFRSDCSIIGIY